ncbi:MAG: HAMP domain-containing histidine kinase [Lachnospiraceae bacterium]|nr:HAMP domain-containing histidine kinase [Lachnospiraceae bacterium]
MARATDFNELIEREAALFTNKVIERLDQMIDDALEGKFSESSYDETKLSRLESKWKEFLGTSVLSNQNLEAERHRLEQFISDISHQTKTPMTNIKMYTELLCEEVKGLRMEEPDAGEGAKKDISDACGRIEKYAEQISRQNARLEFLIDSLTKLSRLESGSLEVVAAPSKVLELISAAVSAVRPKADVKRIALITPDAGEEGDVTASFDMKWTIEALGNVLDNAVKYSPEDAAVTVSLSQTDLYVAVHVTDEGEGITEEDAARIFGRFYRGSEVQQEDGVGIGLYLTREILSKEDGYIKVISNEKRKGGEFILYLRKE